LTLKLLFKLALVIASNQDQEWIREMQSETDFMDSQIEKLHWGFSSIIVAIKMRHEQRREGRLKLADTTDQIIKEIRELKEETSSSNTYYVDPGSTSHTHYVES
jgi:hypothetical protein